MRRTAIDVRVLCCCREQEISQERLRSGVGLCRTYSKTVLLKRLKKNVPTNNQDFLQSMAGSTGRCNTGLQFTRRRFKAQGLSRALIQAQSYLVKIGLRVDGQVGLLREVLS
jgi:hypothetical protein